MKPNNFAMRDWHLEHVEKVILRYMKGISPDASSFEKRNLKYGRIGRVSKRIEYDIKHGVTAQEVADLMNKIRNDASYSEVRQKQDAIQRLDELERQLNSPKKLGW